MATDVLLLNQAERDVFNFPKADGTLCTFPTGYKNILLAIKHFGQYCMDEGKPTVNCKQVAKDELSRSRSYSYHVAKESVVHISPRLTLPLFKPQSQLRMYKLSLK